MKRLTYFGLILLFAISCKKVSVKKEYPELAGEYDWLSSSDTSGVVYLNNGASDHYRLHIKNNSKVLIYKNGQKIYREPILSVEELTDTLLVTSGEGHKELVCYVVNGVLTTDDLPYTGLENEFVLIE